MLIAQVLKWVLEQNGSSRDRSTKKAGGGFHGQLSWRAVQVKISGRHDGWSASSHVMAEQRGRVW